jgi:hypothetical protein
MSRIMKPFALGACLVGMMCVDLAPEAPGKLGFLRDAEAIIGVAPGGSVVRRHAVVGTAVVASTSANASAAAAANANAAAANANAAAAASKPPPQAAAPAGPPPVGTIVTTLPPGCATTQLNGVEYQRCGSTYYRAAMQGSILVFVVQQP